MPALRRVLQPVCRTDAGLQAQVVIRRPPRRGPSTYVEPDTDLRDLSRCGADLQPLTLPGIREAIEQRNWKEAQEQIGIAAAVLQKFTDYLSNIR